MTRNAVDRKVSRVRIPNSPFSPALIELQRLLKSPPSGSASPVSAVINQVTVTQLLKVAMRSGSGNADACCQSMPVQILGILRLACPGMIHMKERAIPVGTAFALC